MAKELNEDTGFNVTNTGIENGMTFL